MTTKLEVTKAEDYADVTKQTFPEDAGQLVEMPSKAVFRLRRADIEGMTLIGELPQSLVEETLGALRKEGKVPAEEAKKKEETPDPESSLRQLIFLRQTVVSNCIEPRIGYDESGVVSLLNNEGQAIAKLDKRDFMYAFKWITHQEGLEADGLNSFRNRRERRAANAGPNRKKLRDTPVSVN